MKNVERESVSQPDSVTMSFGEHDPCGAGRAPQPVRPPKVAPDLTQQAQEWYKVKLDAVSTPSGEFWSKEEGRYYAPVELLASFAAHITAGKDREIAETNDRWREHFVNLAECMAVAESAREKAEQENRELREVAHESLVLLGGMAETSDFLGITGPTMRKRIADVADALRTVLAKGDKRD